MPWSQTVWMKVLEMASPVTVSGTIYDLCIPGASPSPLTSYPHHHVLTRLEQNECKGEER